MTPNDLVKLKKEWYAKLEEDGFKDLEYFDSNMEPRDWMKGTSKFIMTIPSMDEQSFVHEPSLVYQTTYDYYHAAQSSSADKDFADDSHKQIWELYASGLSLRKIAKIVGFSHPKVLRILNKYR